MGDYSAFAAVTRALVNRLQSAISEVGGPIGNAVVLPRAPDVPEQLVLPCVTLFLYHVVPNADFRNADLPTRGSDGQIIKRPRAAFDLLYLLSFYGADTPDRLETQMLWGLTTAEFHANPFLTPMDILAAQAELRAGPGALEAAVADAHELRIVTHGLDTDTMSRLWQSFPFANYVPSMVYKVGPCFVGVDNWPAPPLPVRQRHLHKTAKPSDSAGSGPASGGGASPDAAVDRPYAFGDTMRILGLSSGQSTIWLGSCKVTGTTAADGALLVPLTDPSIPVGSQVPVRVSSDTSTAPEFYVDIRPAIAPITGPVPTNAPITLEVLPPPAASQDVRLFLNARAGGHGRILSGLPAADTSQATGTVTFPPANLPVGEYLARVSVSSTDGSDRRIDSLLDWSPSAGRSGAAFTGPLLTLSAGGPDV